MSEILSLNQTLLSERYRCELAMTTSPFFLSGCPPGWCVYGGSCYKLNLSNSSFSDAISFCKKTINAYLVEIQSGNENSFVAGLFADDLWIGYSDQRQEGEWLWNTTGLVGNYTNWYVYPAGSNRFEPNNAYGVQHCAMIWGSNPGRTSWDDKECWYQTRFVCERGK